MFNSTTTVRPTVLVLCDDYSFQLTKYKMETRSNDYGDQGCITNVCSIEYSRFQVQPITQIEQPWSLPGFDVNLALAFFCNRLVCVVFKQALLLFAVKFVTQFK